MAKKKLYTLDYENPSGTFRFGEYDVPLPAMPPQKEMINYGLPVHKQKFQRTDIPKSLLKRKKVLAPEEEEFIENEYHKRFNGVWILIKGQPIYLPGPYYHYLNYWWTKNNKHPDFRLVQCKLYQFWDMVVRDPLAYGMFLIKPRRMGGTEMTLHLEYEYATRVRSVHCGMQSKNDNSGYVNYKRLTRANKKMIWFMKPIHKGSEDPDGGLEFFYPVRLNTAKSMASMAELGEEEESNYEYEELASKVTQGPSVATHYDGEELNRYILNEFGKLEKMSAWECWDKVKPCLHYDGGGEIVGKAMFESTIEEINDDQIQELNEFWKDSNPADRDENGNTTTGLYRLFLNTLDTAAEDEFGFPKTEEKRIRIENTIKSLQKKGKQKELSAYKRKEPMSVEDALTPSGNQSAFNKEHLQDTFSRLANPEDPYKKFGTRGNFIWAGGIVDGHVIFEPNETGKFFVTQLLKDGEDNAQVIMGGIRYPGNTHRFRGGVDPYEHEKVQDQYKASKGGGVMMKLYDDLADGAKTLNGAPIDLGWEWETNQPVATYCERPDDPKEFFEDMLMMHVYYGTQMLAEINKQSIKTYFRDRGYGEYIMARPESTLPANAKGSAPDGIPATTQTINQYFDAIASYVMWYCNAIKHIELIRDLLEMNRGNQTKHDLGVAFGWALIACTKKYLRNPALEAAAQDGGPEWFEESEI